jgi:poly-beta-hydroxyalkanoate depolymerase
MAIPSIPKQHRDNITPISKEEAAENFLTEIENKSKQTQTQKPQAHAGLFQAGHKNRISPGRRGNGGQSIHLD